jgi:hypothetical protein
MQGGTSHPRSVPMGTRAASPSTRPEPSISHGASGVGRPAGFIFGCAWTLRRGTCIAGQKRKIGLGGNQRNARRMQKRANRFGWRIAAQLNAGWALKGANTGAGSRCGAGILGKRGRADGVLPEAGPRVADAGWHKPSVIGPDGHLVNVGGWGEAYRHRPTRARWASISTK